jgi:hypothetical protein
MIPVVTKQYWLFPKGWYAINLFGITFLRKDWADLVHRDSQRWKQTMRHYRIHSMQIFEMLFIPFYLWFVVEVWIRYRYFKKKYKDDDLNDPNTTETKTRKLLNFAYYDTAFEREAYFGDSQFGYLKKRLPYAWVKFLRKRD